MSDPSEPTTLGAYLREARRRKRVSLERAAEQTRIRADFLMRMESDDFDFLAPAYVRGFLTSYARFLGIPIEPVQEEFDRRFGTGTVDTAQMIAIDRKRARTTGERRFGPVAIVLFAVAALLLIFAVIGLAAGDDNRGDGRVAINPQDSPSPSATPTETPSPTPAVTPAETFTPSTPSTPQPTEDPVALPADKALEFEIVAARGDSWAEVTVEGTTVFAETIAKGEFRTFFAEEGEKMSVILGAARDVDLVVNGQELPRQQADVLEFTLPDDIGLLGG